MAKKKKRKKYDVFISYSLKDAHLVDGIEKLLSVSGRKVFRDSSSIALGTRWKGEIESALANSKLLVVCWCCHSKQSKYVKWETTVALRRKMKVLPILLCDEALVPRLRPWEWIDMRWNARHPCECLRVETATGSRFGAILKPRTVYSSRRVAMKMVEFPEAESRFELEIMACLKPTRLDVEAVQRLIVNHIEEALAKGALGE